MAFTVLMIALIPLSYLFTDSVIQAGQSKNQQTALSIAEKWAEVGSNITPPVNCNGEVVVDQSVAPVGPGSGSTTVAAPSNNVALATQTTINVASTATFAAAPQTALIATSAGLKSVTYTAKSATTLTIPINSGTGTIFTGCPVTQPTTSETKGSTTYSLNAEYEWTSLQSAGNGKTTVTTAVNSSNPASVISLSVTSTTSFTNASAQSPQTAVVSLSSGGVQTISYTNKTPTSLTGITGWTVGQLNIPANALVTQSLKPNLCASGTPQLLKLRMTVGWGPNSDTNNVQDSIVLNYPPAGIQTLGFLALQLTGDTTATDSQGNPWNLRVQAPPVTITGPQNLTIYPDNYGCAFAQVLPTSVGNTYTVGVGSAANGTPAGSAYGPPSPLFVANGAGSVTSHVLQQPQFESQSGVTVTIGAVTKLAGTFPTAYPGYDQGSVVNLSYPNSSAVEDGVVCPGVGQITCIATGQSSSGAVLSWSYHSTWTSVALPAPATRISSIACAGTVECEAVGYNLVGGVSSPVIFDANPSTPSMSTPSTGAALTGVTSLSQIACPSATNCVAIGTTATGAAVLTDTISPTGVNSWVADALPANITGLSSLVCPPSAGGCVALGTTSTPSSGTPTIVSGGFGLAWSANSLNPTNVTMASITALACPSSSASTTCLAVGIGKVGSGTNGPMVISGAAPAGLGSAAPSWTWTADSFPVGTTVASLNGLSCPSQPATECLVTGVGTIGAGPVPLVMNGATTPSATFANDTLPSAASGAITSISQLTCPSSGLCMIIGATATAPAILTASIAPDNWTNVTVPTPTTGSLSQLSQLKCWSSTSCAITAIGTNTSTNQPAAFLLASSGGTASANWSSVGLPATSSALYLGSIDCGGSGTSDCSSVGSSPTRSVVFSSTNGPSGSWADQTPSGLAGSPVAGVPVEINNTGLPTVPYIGGYATAVTAGAAANVTSLPDLYPFNNGYGLFAGDCAAELGTGSFNLSQAATTPGGTSNATVPLGLIVVQATHLTGASVGLPYAGARFGLTATTSGCAGDTYTLQTAGQDGLSRTEVPYGTYTLTVTGTTPAVTETVNVGGNTVVANGVTTLVPNPVLVSVT